jgi:hypothetical protein
LTLRVVLLETYPSRAPPLVELDDTGAGARAGPETRAGSGALSFGRYEMAVNAAEEMYWDNPAEVTASPIP